MCGGSFWLVLSFPDRRGALASVELAVSRLAASERSFGIRCRALTEPVSTAKCSCALLLLHSLVSLRQGVVVLRIHRSSPAGYSDAHLKASLAKSQPTVPTSLYVTHASEAVCCPTGIFQFLLYPSASQSALGSRAGCHSCQISKCRYW